MGRQRKMVIKNIKQKEVIMSKIFKVILGLSLLSSMHVDAAAGRFARGAWKFIKSPSIALGVTGSLGVYTGMNHMVKTLVNDVKEQSIAQANDPEIALQQEKIRAFCKEKGVKVDYPTFDAMQVGPATFKGGVVNVYNDTVIIRLGDEFKANSTTPQAEQDFVIGHEIRHIANDDMPHRTESVTAIPLGAGLTGHLLRISGRGRISSTLASVGVIIAGTKASFGYIRYQETRADKEASSDTEILEAGANIYKKWHKEEQEIRNALSPEMKELQAKIDFLMPLSHPPYQERIEALHKQAAKLRAEQEINK